MVVWIGFLILIFIFLALDLGVFNREPHKISTKEALGWTALWVFMALLFSVFIYFGYENHWLDLGIEVGHNVKGSVAFFDYFTGFLIEKSLSLDNIFVIAVIFSYFQIPTKYQHRVLFWGILGAIVFRGIMIFAGVYLLEKFSFITYIFGLILLWTAWKMMQSNHEEIHPESNPIVLQLRKYLPVTKGLKQERFFVKNKGKVVAMTPLFVSLVVVESTDVMFAVDSIPAIFAITTDPFIVFTSNIFAILGLRSLYFVLASILDKFKYLKYSLVIILAYVGIKMMLVHHIKIPSFLSLSFIVIVLAAGVFYSLYKDKQEEKHAGRSRHPKNE
jgi:tellurite resistance protein TerC